MAADERERSPKPSRKSSNSSNSRVVTVKPGTIRTKPLPQDTRRPRTPSTAEESSLTSFPSLSPSLANSPVSSPHTTQRFHALSVPTDDEYTQRSSGVGRAEGLFAGDQIQDGRSALFEDSPNSKRPVPGTLHLQSPKHLEHLITRVGAVPLVKQMAEDLAHRDAQITSLQRRAEERERLLRKMLRECEVSNLKIEGRLKELEEHQALQHQSMTASRKSQALESTLLSDATIDEQISEAFVDILGGNEARNGDAELRHVSKVHGTGSNTPIRRVSTEQVTSKSGTVRKKSTSKGWKSFFGGQSEEQKDQRTIRAPMHRTASAQERLQRIHTASQADLRRRGLFTDHSKPPPVPNSNPTSRKSSVPNGVPETSNVNDSGEIASMKSGTSLASWATRLVGGKTPSIDSANQSRDDLEQPLTRSTTTDTTSSSSKIKGQSGNTATNSKPMTAKPQSGTALNTAVANVRNDARSPRAAFMVGSPNEQTSLSDANPGPVEMDTILPDDKRPPTLLPYDGKGDSSEFLTDRYGFIYDQRRRARQHMAANPPKDHGKQRNRVETLEGHRRSWNSLTTGDGDAASLMSQKSNDTTDALQSSPINADTSSEIQAPKRWQDYLKLSTFSTELLSHTPSVAPTTRVITAEEATNGVPKPLIQVSRHGSIVSPTQNLEPAPSQIGSGDAEFAQSAEPTASIGNPATDLQSADPVKSLLDQLTDIYDASQREKESRWNDFLRKVSADRRRQGEASSNERRSKSLAAIPEASLMDGEIIGITSLGNEGKAGRTKWLEFKNLLLGGIPLALRPKVWAECSGALSSKVPGHYEEMIRSPPKDEVIIQQIAMDIPRTLTDNIYFRQGDGMAKLSEVLLAYSQRNPEVGYCQGMNLIAANLLLVMPTAEDAFWMLATLVEKILPDKYYGHNLLTSRADQAVLRQYVGTVLPNLSAHLEDLSIDLEALTFQWFLSVFTDCLSAEALFRVWDVMLCTPYDAGGGATFLFQVALALLKLNEKQLLACESPAEVYVYINGKMTDHAISIDGLIRASEALRRVVRREDVEKKRDVVVEADLELMRQREEVRKGKGLSGFGPPPPPAVGVQRMPSADENGLRKVNSAQSRERPVTPEQDVFSDDLEQITPMPMEEEMQWRA